MTADPFALPIAWTCYGTRLPGDPRGHVSNVLRPGGGWVRKRNIPGTPVAPGSSPLAARRKHGGLSAVRLQGRAAKAPDRVADGYDLHATVLHFLGIDHERLTVRHDGANRRLTDVHGRVLQEILESPLCNSLDDDN